MENTLIGRTAEFVMHSEGGREVSGEVVAVHYENGATGQYVGILLWVREHLSGRMTCIAADHATVTLGDYA